MDKLQEHGQKFSRRQGRKSVVRSIDVVDVGSSSSGLGLPGADTVWTGCYLSSGIALFVFKPENCDVCPLWVRAALAVTNHQARSIAWMRIPAD
jgi:hypothetical protein